MTTPSNIYRANKSVVWWVFLYVSLIFSMIFQTIGHVSGGHVNPAVTAGLLAAGKITIARGVLYIIAQCMGAVAGSAILKVNFNVFYVWSVILLNLYLKKYVFFRLLLQKLLLAIWVWRILLQRCRLFKDSELNSSLVSSSFWSCSG